MSGGHASGSHASGRAERQGCYVALDGPDGCGKSSQAKSLASWLMAEGADVLHVREPGSTPVGEALRNLLLADSTGDLQPITEVLLFSAARAELVQRVVDPALRQGKVVVAERCYLSTAVYQILAGGVGSSGSAAGDGVIDARWFEDLTRRVHGSCLPDRIFVLDVPAEVSAERRGHRIEDRIEARGDAFHRRVRDGYLLAAEREPRAEVVDASESFDQVQATLRQALQRLT